MGRSAVGVRRRYRRPVPLSRRGCRRPAAGEARRPRRPRCARPRGRAWRPPPAPPPPRPAGGIPPNPPRPQGPPARKEPAGIEAHHVMGFFRGMNDQVRSATGGPGLTLLVPLALLLLGVRGFLTAKEVAAPRWYDLLWFGFATFLMLNAAGVPTAKAAEEAAEIAATV